MRSDPTTRMDREIWKTITGFPAYKVSNMGRFKRVGKKLNNQPIYNPILTPTRVTSGHLAVNLNGKVLSAHRVVVEAFIGKIPAGLEVNHKNGDPKDNRVFNLEIVTRRENVLHAIRVLHRWSPPDNSGEKHGMSKLTKAKVKAMRAMDSRGVKRAALARRFGVCPSTVSRICNRQGWLV